MMNFVEFAATHNVRIDRLYQSDKIQRVGTVEKPKSKNGAYFWDGERGWVMDWSGEARVIWFESGRAKPWTPEEKRLWASKRASDASAREEEYQAAANKAESILKAAEKSTHDYLRFKCFEDVQCLVLDGKLLVPMRNVRTNRLQGIQFIWWNGNDRKWEKKMLPGMRAKNAVFWLGDRNSEEVWLVEGYATGLSVREALKSCGMDAAVVVTFSASNLVQVADQIRGRRFVFADNDESKTGEKAADQTGLPWTMADEVGWDANDLHMHSGLFAVVNKIMMCRVKSSVYA